MLKKNFDLKLFVVTLLLLAISSLFLSRLTPPFMSPDEQDHIKRSYLLSKGKFILSSQNNQSSGGYIDDGLLRYINNYPFDMRKLSSPYDNANVASISWQHTRTYSPAAGTAFYLPIIYLPQTIALFIGEHLNLKVSSSFYLARFFNIITEYILIFFAFLIYRKSILPLALCLLPMTMFQAAAASIDGVSLAIFVLCMAIFFKTQKESSNNIKLVYLLGCLEVILITCRLQAAPLIFLFIPIFHNTKNKKVILIAGATLLAISAWLGITLLATVDHRIHQTLPTIQIAEFYLLHPLTFAHILANTLSDPFIRKTYIHQYLGQLGWMDIGFNHKIYLSLKIMTFIIIITISSFTLKYIKERIFLFFLGFLSIFCVFFPLLVTWNIYPCTKITGVQGRYFMIASLLFTYALSMRQNDLPKTRKICALSTCVLLFTFSFYETTTHIVQRYYTAPYFPQIIQMLENSKAHHDYFLQHNSHLYRAGKDHFLL